MIAVLLFLLTVSDVRASIDWTSGTIYGFSGFSGFAGFSGDNSFASTALLNNPRSVQVTNNGNVYIADSDNARIRKVDAITNIIDTVAGASPTNDGNGCEDSTQPLSCRMVPYNMVLDQSSDLYYITGCGVEKVRVSMNVVQIVAGSLTIYYNNYVNNYKTFPCQNGPDGVKATTSYLNNPSSIAISSNDLIIADTDSYRVRKVEFASGIIYTIAGTGTACDKFSVFNNVAATSVNLCAPRGVAVDSRDNIFFSDKATIMRIDPDNNNIYTIAGIGEVGYNNFQLPALATPLMSVKKLLVADNGDIVFIDSNRIRVLEASSKIISTIAGSEPEGYSGNNIPAIGATFSYPSDITLSTNGELYVADTGNNVIRKIVFNQANTQSPTHHPTKHPQKHHEEHGTHHKHYQVVNGTEVLIGDDYVIDSFQAFPPMSFRGKILLSVGVILSAIALTVLLLQSAAKDLLRSQPWQLLHIVASLADNVTNILFVTQLARYMEYLKDSSYHGEYIVNEKFLVVTSVALALVALVNIYLLSIHGRVCWYMSQLCPLAMSFFLYEREHFFDWYTHSTAHLSWWHNEDERSVMLKSCFFFLYPLHIACVVLFGVIVSCIVALLRVMVCLLLYGLFAVINAVIFLSCALNCELGFYLYVVREACEIPDTYIPHRHFLITVIGLVIEDVMMLIVQASYLLVEHVEYKQPPSALQITSLVCTIWRMGFGLMHKTLQRRRELRQNNSNKESVANESFFSFFAVPSSNESASISTNLFDDIFNTSSRLPKQSYSHVPKDLSTATEMSPLGHNKVNGDKNIETNTTKPNTNAVFDNFDSVLMSEHDDVFLSATLSSNRFTTINIDDENEKAIDNV